MPLQRPAELGDRRTLTEEEFAARRQRDDETRGDVKADLARGVARQRPRARAHAGRGSAHGRARERREHSAGRWDGDVLVIETSGFTDRTAIAGTRHSEKLKVIERLTRVSDDTITDEATVSDSETWTGPFTVIVPLSTQPGYEVFPYECHEGNNALRNMLSAARAEEKVIDEYVKKGLPPPPRARPGDADILPPDPSFGRRR